MNGPKIWIIHAARIGQSPTDCSPINMQVNIIMDYEQFKTISPLNMKICKRLVLSRKHRKFTSSMKCNSFLLLLPIWPFIWEITFCLSKIAANREANIHTYGIIECNCERQKRAYRTPQSMRHGTARPIEISWSRHNTHKTRIRGKKEMKSIHRSCDWIGELASKDIKFVSFFRHHHQQRRLIAFAMTTNERYIHVKCNRSSMLYLHTPRTSAYAVYTQLHIPVIRIFLSIFGISSEFRACYDIFALQTSEWMEPLCVSLSVCGFVFRVSLYYRSAPARDE